MRLRDNIGEFTLFLTQEQGVEVPNYLFSVNLLVIGRFVYECLRHRLAKTNEGRPLFPRVLAAHHQIDIAQKYLLSSSSVHGELAWPRAKASPHYAPCFTAADEEGSHWNVEPQL